MAVRKRVHVTKDKCLSDFQYETFLIWSLTATASIQPTYWVALLGKASVETVLPAAWAPIRWPLAVADHDVVLLLHFGGPVGDNIALHMLPDGRPLLAALLQQQQLQFKTASRRHLPTNSAVAAGQVVCPPIHAA